jgi:uncharacterized protein YbbK (DUF523 family)
MTSQEVFDKKQVLVSACCLGLSCRYHGRQSVLKAKVEDLLKKYYLVPVCPELLGGLPTPRPAASWVEGKLSFKRKGFRVPRVLQQLQLLTSSEEGDAYSFFVRGATETLIIARVLNIKKAYFLKGSPSCDPKQGICSLLLQKNGIRVIAL